eukprot:COSAG02_NODE_15926_length_1129_cov_1.033981_2_plen_40_part_01
MHTVISIDADPNPFQTPLHLSVKSTDSTGPDYGSLHYMVG